MSAALHPTGTMKLESFWTDTAAAYEGRSDALPAKADVVVISALGEDSDVPESANLMYPNGSDVVAVTDEGNELLVAAIPARLDEPFQQQPANSLAHGLRTDID